MTTTRPLTGHEYLDSLRDGREIWSVGVPLPTTALVHELLQACISSGMGEHDFMALLPRLRREAGLDR